MPTVINWTDVVKFICELSDTVTTTPPDAAALVTFFSNCQRDEISQKGFLGAVRSLQSEGVERIRAFFDQLRVEWERICNAAVLAEQQQRTKERLPDIANSGRRSRVPGTR